MSANWRTSAGRKGGQSRSPAKLAALRRLHASRRGVRINRPGADWPAVREAASSLIRDHPERGRVSLRALSEWCGVSDRTVRRWLSGEDLPSRRAGEKVKLWTTRNKN